MTKPLVYQRGMVIKYRIANWLLTTHLYLKTSFKMPSDKTCRLKNQSIRWEKSLDPRSFCTVVTWT